jgi:anti-sigma factor RsiW
MNDWLDVHALLDDELPAEERAKIQERLKSCDKTQAEYYAVHELKAALATKCLEPECEEVWQKCTKRLDAIDRTKRVESFVSRYAWGICSLFFCFIIGAAVMNRLNGNSLKAGDVERVSASLTPLSAPRSQATDEKRRWLQENLDNSMVLQPGRITLIGGGAGFLTDGRKITRADLQDRDGRLRLYVIQSAGAIDGTEKVGDQSQYSAGRLNNLNCVAWTDHGCAYLLTADRPVDSLVQAADALNKH